MSMMNLIIDCRDGVYNKDTMISNADDNAALSWLEKLDGKKYTLLSLERFDGLNLLIGGGPSWVVVVLEGRNENLTLKNPSGSQTQWMQLCAGGQYGEFQKSICVDKKQADRVVKLFYQGKETQAEWL